MAITFNADTTNGAVITSDTSGEIELQANGVTKAKVTANGLQDANGNSLRGGMYRNLLINGDMQIAQRGTSATGLTTTGYYTVDRWQFYAPSSPTYAFTMSQDTDVPLGQGFSSSVKLDCTTAQTPLATNSQLVLRHMIEGQHLQHLAYGTANAKSTTFSFWVKSNKTGTYITNLYQASGTRTISKSYTIDTADTWEKKTITFEGDTSGTINNNNGIGLYVMFHLAMGSNFQSGALSTSWASYTSSNYSVGQVNLADSTSNYINITGVQLEVGEGASDFEHLPYDVQLARCQRYYIQYNQDKQIYGHISIGGLAASTTECRHALAFPTTMRTVPSVSHNALLVQDGVTITAVTSVNTVGNQTSRESGFVLCNVASGLTQYRPYQLQANNNVNGYLAFSAEL